MKLIKHFYYPYFYIEKYNGSIILIFFLDHTFYFEDEEDIFVHRVVINALKKSKKVIEEANNFKILDKLKEKNEVIKFTNFFEEFFNYNK